jgi:ABC-type uncharacterized transport system auxiliary subunit
VKRFCWIATLCTLASACAVGRPIKYYRLEVPAPAAVAAAADPVFGVTIQVGTIDSPPLMRDGRILYQVGAHEVGAYEYHRWVETPDRMVQNSLVRLLRSSLKYQSVDNQRSTVRADYIVRGRIYEFAEIDKPEIHTRVSMEIELQDIKSSRTVWSRLYTNEESVGGKEIPDVVESLDQNLRRGLSEIVAALDQFFAGRAAQSERPIQSTSGKQ